MRRDSALFRTMDQTNDPDLLAAPDRRRGAPGPPAPGGPPAAQGAEAVSPTPADRVSRENGVRRPGKNPKRGMLKIFFGMARGVGKTSAMLAEAHREQAAG